MTKLIPIKRLVLKQEKKISEERTWLAAHGLDLSVIQPQVDELNSNLKQIKKLRKKETAVNDFMHRKF